MGKTKSRRGRRGNPLGPIFQHIRAKGRGFPWGVWTPDDGGQSGDFLGEIRLSFPANGDRINVTPEQHEEVIRALKNANLIPYDPNFTQESFEENLSINDSGDFMVIEDWTGGDRVLELIGMPEEENQPNPLGPIFQHMKPKKDYARRENWKQLPDHLKETGKVVAVTDSRWAPCSIIIAKVYSDPDNANELVYSIKDDDSSILSSTDEIPMIAHEQGWVGPHASRDKRDEMFDRLWNKGLNGLTSEEWDDAEYWFSDNEEVPFDDPGYF